MIAFHTLRRVVTYLCHHLGGYTLKINAFYYLLLDGHQDKIPGDFRDAIKYGRLDLVTVNKLRNPVYSQRSNLVRDLSKLMAEGLLERKKKGNYQLVPGPAQPIVESLKMPTQENKGDIDRGDHIRKIIRSQLTWGEAVQLIGFPKMKRSNRPERKITISHFSHGRRSIHSPWWYRGSP